MLRSEYSFEELKLSSQLVRDLIQNDTKLEPLVSHFFDEDNIEKQIQLKLFDSNKRKSLVDALKNQYANSETSDRTLQNIDLLKRENTFTITTGHQLNLMGGPLYSIYKVSQCVALTEELNKKYPSYNFVPLFWMATEDHDFEEINHIHLFGQKIRSKFSPGNVRNR